MGGPCFFPQTSKLQSSKPVKFKGKIVKDYMLE